MLKNVTLAVVTGEDTSRYYKRSHYRSTYKVLEHDIDSATFALGERLDQSQVHHYTRLSPTSFSETTVTARDGVCVKMEVVMHTAPYSEDVQAAVDRLSTGFAGEEITALEYGEAILRALAQVS